LFGVKHVVFRKEKQNPPACLGKCVKFSPADKCAEKLKIGNKENSVKDYFWNARERRLMSSLEWVNCGGGGPGGFIGVS